MEGMDNITVAQRYKRAIGDYGRLFKGEASTGGRKDSTKYQSKLFRLIKEFKLIKSIVDNLSLFSDNESIEEASTSYIPFLNIDYYLGNLYQSCLVDSKTNRVEESINPIAYKADNLLLSRHRFILYLALLDDYGILSKAQSSIINSFKETYNPTLDELVPSNHNPASKRAEKINNYKSEKELAAKLEILDEYYNPKGQDEDFIFETFDEETVRSIYVDQLRLFSLKTFNSLESIILELQVLSNIPKTFVSRKDGPKPKEAPSKENDYGYTTKLEPSVFLKKDITELISKQGKILQPFTIVSNKQQLKERVFGTGQVMPSMTVEEYLEYELSHGKMLKDEVKDSTRNDSDTDKSEDELEKRRWDDWKDDNPKGSGNMKANIG